MRTIHRFWHLFIPLAFIAAIFIFPACEEEGGDMEAVIRVRYLGDTSTPVPGALVILEKNDVFQKGHTDENGEYSHVFQLEAILDVIATKDTGDTTPVTLSGSSIIRLQPGKTVYRTVYLGQ
jgi:hypothetical protein